MGLLAEPLLSNTVRSMKLPLNTDDYNAILQTCHGKCHFGSVTKQLKWDKTGQGEVTIKNTATVVYSSY